MARQRDPRTKAAGTSTFSDPAHRMPAPDAREGGESLWQQWQEASRRLDLAFAPTEPSGLAPVSMGGDVAEAVATPPRSHLLTVHALMVLARRNNRVCPHPNQWLALYRMLEGERHASLQPPPVQSWLWPNLSGLQKRLRFREHVEWADRHGQLGVVAHFIGGLAETDWLHMGED